MRQSTLALVLLTVAVGVSLFLVKYRVQGLEEQLQDLNRNITADREKIHVLKAEWSHFNEPKRLKALAGRHLDMIPIEAGQVTTPEGLERNIPERPETATAETANAEMAAESGDTAGKEFRP